MKLGLTYVLLILIVVGLAVGEDDFGPSQGERIPPDKSSFVDQFKSDPYAALSSGSPSDIQKLSDSQINSLSMSDSRMTSDLASKVLDRLNSENVGKAFDSGKIKSEDVKRLSYDQLKDNLNKVGDVSLVKEDVRNRVLSERAGVDVKTKDLEKGTKAQVFNDGFTLDKATAIQVGDSFVNNAQGVQFRSGTLSVVKADGMLVPDGHLILLEKLEKTGTTIKVDRADEVKVGCVKAKKVRDSVFTKTDKVSIKSKVGSKYLVEACGGNLLDYESENVDNELTIKSISVVEDALVFGKNIVLSGQNNIINLSSGQADMDLISGAGFHCVNLSNPSFYEWNRTESSSFRIVPKSNVELCLKRDAKQPLKLNCQNCVNIDFVNSEIYINAEVDYLRKIEGVWTTVIENKGVTTLKLDRVMQIDEMLVSSGETITTPSDYFSIVELPTKKGVHRMLKIDPTVQNPSDSLIAKYRTDYSPASMEVKNNYVVYKRGVLTVEVLPPEPESRAIKRLLADLDSQESLIFTSFALILASLWFARKGQVSIFILIGVVMLIVVGLLIYGAGLLRIVLPSSDVFDKIDIFVGNCLEQGAYNALLTLGRYGDFVPADASLKIHTLRNLDRNVVTEKLVNFIDTNLNKCMNNLTSFPGISLIDGEKKYSFDLNENDVRVNVDYPFTAVQGDKSRTYSKFVATVPVRLDSILNNVIATTYSYQETGMIDLDALTGDLRIVIWPYDKRLLISIIDESSNIKERKYMFTLALRHS